VALMRPGVDVTSIEVTRALDSDDDGTDDNHQVGGGSSAEQIIDPGIRRIRNKRLLSAIKKLNMCFLVIFVAFVVWTIASSHGNGNARVEAIAANQTTFSNFSSQVSRIHFSA